VNCRVLKARQWSLFWSRWMQSTIWHFIALWPTLWIASRSCQCSCSRSVHGLLGGTEKNHWKPQENLCCGRRSNGVRNENCSVVLQVDSTWFFGLKLRRRNACNAVWCYVTVRLKCAVTVKFLCDCIELKIEMNEECKILNFLFA